MTKTKDQQAQEYVLNRQTVRHNAKTDEDATMRDFDKTVKAWDSYDMEQAFEDGYTACEQSLWRSVEEELPQKNGDYLICTEYREIEIAFWEDNYWLGNDSYPVRNVTHWRELPSLPETNTEKK